MSSRAGRHSQLDVARLTLWYSQPKARVDFGCSLRVLLLRAGCCDAMCVRFDRLRRTLIAHRNALEPTDWFPYASSFAVRTIAAATQYCGDPMAPRCAHYASIGRRLFFRDVYGDQSSRFLARSDL